MRIVVAISVLGKTLASLITGEFTLEKSWLNAVCGKCFSHKANLMQQQRIHTDKDMCTECAKSYREHCTLFNTQGHL